MITQVYQVGTEKWIEITNTHPTNSVAGGLINIQLYSDVFRSDQTNVVPTVSYTVPSALAAGKSVLLKSTANVITNFDNSIPANVIDNNAITIFNGGNDIISLSTTTDATSWANRYDVVSSFEDNTCFVRIDEALTSNTVYTPNEWVVFINDALDPYRLLGNGGAERHPHDPLLSEVTGADVNANTYLGLHKTDITTRTGGTWNNGSPDRSRFVVIDQDYNHSGNKLSARKLTVNASRILGITDNLLVVTGDVILNGDIRLINSTGATGNSESQFIQTNTSASLVSGSGRLLVDQNSSVPSLYRYNYMGSPVISASGATTYTISDVFKDGTDPTSFDGIINTSIAKNITFLTGTNYDGDTTDPITLADYWMYTYASSDGGGASWVQKRSGTAIPNTDGFIFKGPGRAQNYTFLGIPKDGTMTTTVGANESYLVANPYTSAISVKEFIEDNNDAITGTLYFWKHAGELDASGDVSGHFFKGYVGGYATRTIATGVTAKAANLSGETGMVDITLEAEATENTIRGELEGTAILLNSATDSITFNQIARSVDSVRIRYKSSGSKTINLKVNDVIKTTVTLPSTSGVFNTEVVSFCVFVGSNITIASTNTDTVIIDYLNLYDMNGEVSCSPTSGDAIFQEPEAYIPIGQGFFVSGDSDGGTITFNNSQREYKTEGAGSSVFFKSSTKSKKTGFNLPIIKLGMDFKEDNDDNEYHRQIAISFSSYTSFAYDKGYDADIFDIGTTDFYWKFPENDSKYVITGVQNISNSLQVPLEIIVGIEGNVKFVIDDMKNVNSNIYILDKLTEKSYNLSNDKVNIFLEKGIYTNRFYLGFAPLDQTLSSEKDILNENYLAIYTDNIKNIITIIKSEKTSITEIELYNILGSKIQQWNPKNNDNINVKINQQLPIGIYIVKLKTSNGEISKKIFIE